MRNSIIVKIEKLIPGGKGLCRVDGKVVFVPFVAAGEEVEIVIREERKGYSEAELVRIINPSAERVEPRCPFYYKCGGCNLQHLSYGEQLRVKSDFAENLLLRNGKIRRSAIEITPSEPYGYRNRVQIHFSNGNRGFRERAGNGIISINNCPVAVPAINRFLGKQEKGEGKDRLTVFGHGDWYSTENENSDISVDVQGKKIFFKSSLFFQSNVSILNSLSEYLNNHVQGDTLLDLYCGVGLLSSMVEDKFNFIKAVEINRHVASYIARNLSTEFQFFPLSMEKWISSGKSRGRSDTIIIDPPRTGLTKPVRRFLSDSKAQKIIYVSCDPATMARDLKDIIADRYIIDDFRLFDFYPQTSHMEAVAVLKKRD